MSTYTLPFEKPILELQTKMEELRSFSKSQGIDVQNELDRMTAHIQETRRKIYADLTPWQKIMVARHPQRPYTRDYIQQIITDFVELHGDRLYADDRAIIGGFGCLQGQRVMVIGTQKGRDTKSNLECNFGCPFPEGYRKALRLMKLAAKFNVPIVTFIDTPGAFPGLESEERHIAEAIAVNLRDMFSLGVPIISVVIGEGGSGGALGIGIANRILILEYAYYSVISPEGCAAILWKDRAYADKAAAALKLTAPDLIESHIADELIGEPPGGAHVNPEIAAHNIEDALVRHLAELTKWTPEQLMEHRYNKYRSIGVFKEGDILAETPPQLPTDE